MTPIDPWLLAGFILASWSVIANDSIQTLGTFLSSNNHRPRWMLWAFATSILLATMIYGWWAHAGDVSYGRLDRFPETVEHAPWIYVVPPLVLLALTRAGIPVSSTFLILTVFAPANLPGMLVKTGIGYVLAFTLGFVVYRFVVHLAEKRFYATDHSEAQGWWVPLQWASTAFLWSQWLIQDLSNVFVYMPRHMSAVTVFSSLAVLVAVLAWVFRSRGGVIQGVVTRKVNTLDVRSATIIDFIYAVILLVFKQASNLPMSTTWVFLGLLAGREIALTVHHRHAEMNSTFRHVGLDAARAGFGIIISVALAIGLPPLANAIAG